MRQPYAIWKIGEDEYKLKLSASAVIAAENDLGASLLASLEKADSIKVQVTILHAAMQKYNANYKRSDVMDLYDDYMDLGGSIEDIMALFKDILEVSGFLAQKKTAAKKSAVAQVK